MMAHKWHRNNAVWCHSGIFARDASVDGEVGRGPFA
jgi:hypothetical protein